MMLQKLYSQSASDSKAKTADINKQQSGSTEATNGNSNNANVAGNTQSTANNEVASGCNSYGGGSQNNYSQGGSNTSQNNTNSGSSNQGQKVIADKIILTLIQTQIQAVMARIQIIMGQMVAITIIISHKHDMLVGYQLTE